MRRIFLIVSIDTECDKGPGWIVQRPMSFKSVTKGVPEILTPLFSKHGVKPTYLLSPEIMHDEESVLIFRKMSHIELGTHLHEEFIEPLSNWTADRTKSIQRDLHYSMEREKLVRLTDLFERCFGYRPLSFRAGRFGIGVGTMRYLDELGYLVDSSVTPFKTHYYESGTVNNFWGRRPFPYKVSGLRILQVPVTIVNRDFSRLPVLVLKCLEDRRTLPRRILNRLGYRSRSEWFRPYRSTSETLIGVAETLIKSCPDGSVPVLNMMFHSNEIIPGASPYCQTLEDVDRYIKSMAETFEYLNRKYDVCSTGLGEYASYFH